MCENYRFVKFVSVNTFKMKSTLNNRFIHRLYMHSSTDRRCVCFSLQSTGMWWRVLSGVSWRSWSGSPSAPTVATGDSRPALPPVACPRRSKKVWRSLVLVAWRTAPVSGALLQPGAAPLPRAAVTHHRVAAPGTSWRSIRRRHLQCRPLSGERPAALRLRPSTRARSRRKCTWSRRRSMTGADHPGRRRRTRRRKRRKRRRR